MTDEYAAGVIQGRGTVRDHWPGREEFVPLLRVEVRDEEVVVALQEHFKCGKILPLLPTHAAGHDHLALVAAGGRRGPRGELRAGLPDGRKAPDGRGPARACGSRDRRLNRPSPGPGVIGEGQGHIAYFRRDPIK